MFDGFDKLPQFLQLCIGLGVVIAAIFAASNAFKVRKIFAQKDPEPDNVQELMSQSRKAAYEKIEEFGRKIDVRYDKLEDRVRQNELDIGILKSNSRSHR